MKKKENPGQHALLKPIVFWEEEKKEEAVVISEEGEQDEVKAEKKPARLSLFKRMICAIQEFAIQVIVIVVGSIVLIVIVNVFWKTGLFDQLGDFVRNLFTG